MEPDTSDTPVKFAVYRLLNLRGLDFIVCIIVLEDGRYSIGAHYISPMHSLHNPDNTKHALQKAEEALKHEHNVDLRHFE